MNCEDLMEAIGIADEEMLEVSEKKRKKWIVGFVSAAAMIILCFTVIWFALQSPGTSRETVYSQKITWNMDQTILVQSQQTVSGAMPEYFAPKYQFAYALSVEAKVIEVLPDTYAIPGSSTGAQRYYVLKMRVLDEIVGEGFPDEIFYLLPNTLDPDLVGYDSIILTLQQVGMENYIMINVAQRQVEVFDFVFWKTPDYAEENGAFMAFNNGKLDVGLWEKAGWSSTKDRMTALVSVENGIYPGNIHRDIDQTKEQILSLFEKYNRFGRDIRMKVGSYKQLNWKEARTLLDELTPFKNGTFYQYYQEDPAGLVCFTRIINGFATNERIYFYTEEKTAFRYGPQFTGEDMDHLPDLVWVIENLEVVLPPDDTTEAAMKRFCGVGGTYYKTQDGIYGVVTVLWGNPDYENPKGPTCLIAASVTEKTCILVHVDGTYEIKTEEELKIILGE